jgi:hypothetical protein
MGNLVFQATLGGQVNLVGPNTASTFNLNVPAVSSTLATLTGTETFTNKTLTSPTLTTPILGTPSSGTLTNCTGLPNAGLVNSSVTVGSTAISLGGTATTVAGLTSLATNTLTSAASTALTLQSAGTTAITVDTSQNVGIGTSSPAQRLEVASSTGGTIGLRYVGNTGYATIGTNSNNEILFSIGNPPSSGEKARIDSSGNVLVGTTSATGSSRFVVAADTTSTNVMTVSNTRSTASTDYSILFYRNGSIVGSVQTTLSATSFVTSSDYRLKEDIQPMTGALAKVAQLNPVTYKWKLDGTEAQGFIAHELQAVVPDCVTGSKDELDAEGNPKYQGIDTSFLVATLTAAIQELKAINDTQAETINALTARLVALEAK